MTITKMDDCTYRFSSKPTGEFTLRNKNIIAVFRHMADLWTGLKKDEHSYVSNMLVTVGLNGQFYWKTKTTGRYSFDLTMAVSMGTWFQRCGVEIPEMFL